MEQIRLECLVRRSQFAAKILRFVLTETLVQLLDKAVASINRYLSGVTGLLRVCFRILDSILLTLKLASLREQLGCLLVVYLLVIHRVLLALGTDAGVALLDRCLHQVG